MTVLETAAHDISRDPAYAELKRHIVDMTGLAYYLEKDVELALYIGRRLQALQIADCGSYLAILLGEHSGAEELDELTATLTNGETFFFRHQELFDALREQIIPEMIDRNRQQRCLRIWSAGCANGAEPYSLSMLLQREFGPQLAGWDVSIVGTDINRQFLAQGERGEFGDWSLRSMSEDLQASCFQRTGNTWTVNDAYRRGVLFRYHNLVQQPFPALISGLAAFDLILCRNVMIYFAPPIIERLIGQFHDSLVAGGCLAVGTSEPNVGLFRKFETVNASGAVFYRRRQRSALPDIALIEPSPTSLLPVAGKAEPCRRPIPRISRGAASPLADARRESAYAVDQALAEAHRKLNLGHSDAAADDCQRLLAAEPMNPIVHFYGALVARHQGRHGETERALRRAIYLDRDFVLAHYHLGLVLLRRREVGGAQRSFRNVLALLELRDDGEIFPDADGLTVEALRQLTDMQMEMLNCT